MGGGRNFRDDVKRRGGTDLLEAASSLSSGLEASGGALSTADEFCAREHRLRFRLTNGLAPEAGEVVGLLAGEPLRLVGPQGEVGVIESGQAAAINNCLDHRWRMTGTVLSVDVAAKRGVARVVGEH